MFWPVRSPFASRALGLALPTTDANLVVHIFLSRSKFTLKLCQSAMEDLNSTLSCVLPTVEELAHKYL